MVKSPLSRDFLGSAKIVDRFVETYIQIRKYFVWWFTNNYWIRFVFEKVWGLFHVIFYTNIFKSPLLLPIKLRFMGVLLQGILTKDCTHQILRFFWFEVSYLMLSCLLFKKVWCTAFQDWILNIESFTLIRTALSFQFVFWHFYFWEIWVKIVLGMGLWKPMKHFYEFGRTIVILIFYRYLRFAWNGRIFQESSFDCQKINLIALLRFWFILI